MGELVILDDWKKKKEEEEIESLRKELEDLMSSFDPVEPAPYFNPIEIDSSFFHTSLSGIHGWTYDYKLDGEET
tara:strand:+ start:70 stop:291 length:222 start_codon:yes stop_codon:yes gene_type:complete